MSRFSEEAQIKIDRYYTLKKKAKRTPQEESELQMDMPILQQAIGLEVPKSGLEKKMDQYLDKMLK